MKCQKHLDIEVSEEMIKNYPPYGCPICNTEYQDEKTRDWRKTWRRK